jgi:choline dehydrogenase-like flavoprotein
MGVVVRNPPITALDTHKVCGAGTYGARPLTSAQVLVEQRHRVAAETPPGHVGLIGLLMPWSGGSKPLTAAATAAAAAAATSSAGSSGLAAGSTDRTSGLEGGLSLKLALINWRNSGVFISIPRDRTCAANRVTVDWAGNPVVHYTCTPEDEALVLAGLEMNIRALRAAGCQFLFAAHEHFPWYSCAKLHPGETAAEEEARFEAYIRSVYLEGLHTARMQVFSAHQMGSCRMAASPAVGPTSPSGELYECANVFVSDASVFPTSTGINPMVTIEAISHMTAKNVIAAIKQEYPAVGASMKAFSNKVQNKQW